MSVKTIKIDDLDGSETVAEETVEFSLDGKNYEIDLSSQNAAKLRNVLAPYMVVARSTGRSSASRRTVSVTSRRVDRDQTMAIREWARGQGLQVSQKGRISQSIVDAFNAGHSPVEFSEVGA